MIPNGSELIAKIFSFLSERWFHIKAGFLFEFGPRLN
jgi:hypothetical protein